MHGASTPGLCTTRAQQKCPCHQSGLERGASQRPFQTVRPTRRTWLLPAWPLAKSTSLCSPGQTMHCPSPIAQPPSLCSPVCSCGTPTGEGLRVQNPGFFLEKPRWILSFSMFSPLLYCPLIPTRRYQVAIITAFACSGPHICAMTDVYGLVFPFCFGKLA